jgi:5-methylcytosine-specific restriction endonuclease McrA
MSKRKKVTPILRNQVLERQKYECDMCKKLFREMKVRPKFHHKNLHPEDNRPENIIAVCPNCHDRIHQDTYKVRAKTIDKNGKPVVKVVTKVVDDRKEITINVKKK